MSKEKYGKGYVFRLAVNVLLLCEYLYLLYTVLSAFSFIPWYDQLGTSFIHYIFLWIPLCATTLVLVVTMFLTRKVYRLRVILVCRIRYLIFYYFRFRRKEQNSLTGNGYIKAAGYADCS